MKGYKRWKEMKQFLWWLKGFRGICARYGKLERMVAALIHWMYLHLFALCENALATNGDGLLGRVHTKQSNTNTSEIDTSREHTSTFVIASTHPSKCLEPPEKPLLLIPSCIEFLAILLRMSVVPFRRHHRSISQFPCRTPDLLVFIRPLRQQITRMLPDSDSFQ
ncbi:MAG: hypothetical protein LBB61_02390 [Treponema sp.]|nr:hypothetical protein [Treponema sp.]